MKAYDFAQLQARWYPSQVEINNQYIYGNIRCVVNVSEKPYSDELICAFKRCGISYFQFPLNETTEDMGLENILKAVSVLEEADKNGFPAIVHCDWGNNRSRVVAEAFYFRKTGSHFEDEYKGAKNHLVYNCNEGHLPSLQIIENKLKNI